MKFDVFGRTLLVERTDSRWTVYYIGPEGKRRSAHSEIEIPPELTEAEIEEWLFDLCHEWATAKNSRVRRLD